MSGTRSTVHIPVADDVSLAATLFLPEHGRPVPALLEALPYRKDDSSDRASYARLRDEFDFAVCRVDVRGTGSSQGIATDEYPLTELDDLSAVIAWLAAQQWCNGSVGMFGWSYSGFNSLQLAAVRPPALKAIVPIYSSDDTYTDDVHYMGGSLRLLDLVDYPSYMIAMNYLPPVPGLAGADWREQWRERIENHEPWVLRWLTEQRRQPYWQHGSLRPDYDRIACPTMIVAGWADGYRNNTFRTVEALAKAGTPYRLLIGPWSHMGAETSLPGPWIDFTPELAKWFDRWLRDVDAQSRTSVVDHAPAVTLFHRHATPPEPDQAEIAGEWIDEPGLPLDRTRPRRLALGDGVVEHAVRSSVGTAAWNSCAASLPWGQPTDQRFDDAASLTWDWPVTELASDELALLGHPVLRVRVAADQPVAAVSAKLCDVYPDGTSVLITRGFLNLTHRMGHDVDPEPLTPGEFVEVDVELEAMAYQLPPGHRLRLALAGTDWPNTIAPPRPVTLSIDRSGSSLEIPVLVGESPCPPPPLVHLRPDELSSGEGVVWKIERDVLARTTTCTTQYRDVDVSLDGLPSTSMYDGRVTIDERTWEQTVHAVARFDVEYEQGRVASESVFTLHADAETFEVSVDVRTFDGDELFAQRHWDVSIPRDFA